MERIPRIARRRIYRKDEAQIGYDVLNQQKIKYSTIQNSPKVNYGVSEKIGQ